MNTGRTPNRRLLSVFLTLVLVFTVVVSASAASTSKKLSTNFTLVNLEPGANSGTVDYYLETGAAWKTPGDTFNFANQGDQLILRQYDDPNLPAGDGSVVVSASGKVGAVVQIQARDGQVPTSAAYSGATAGAAKTILPLVSRQGSSRDGKTNSQMVIQNTTAADVTVKVDLIDLTTGATTFTKTNIVIKKGASFEYDLDTETNLPVPWFGSAIVTTTSSGGLAAAIGSFFIGNDTMQTYNGFTSVGQKWLAPLFTSRLANGLSTPVTVSNAGTTDIPVGGIKLSCKPDPACTNCATINKSNPTVVKPNQSYAFNPVTDTSIPAGWFGSCQTDTTGFDTVEFVQMRFVGSGKAAAYEGINASGTDKTAIDPLFAKKLANGFASAHTIQNLSSSSPANVTIDYKGGTGTAAGCTKSFTKQIPAGGSLIQNLRVDVPFPNSVDIPDGCFGTMTVKSSDQPIATMTQLDFLTQTTGDPYMAHNGFTVP